MQTIPEKQHPILFQDHIDQQGVVVVEVGSMPTKERPFQSENLVIGMCTVGSATFMYDLQPRHFAPQDIGVTLPNHIFTYSTVSPDYRATLIIISPSMYKSIIHRESFIDYQKYHHRPALTLTDEQFIKVRDIIQVLRYTGRGTGLFLNRFNTFIKKKVYFFARFINYVYFCTIFAGQKSKVESQKSKVESQKI